MRLIVYFWIALLTELRIIMHANDHVVKVYSVQWWELKLRWIELNRGLTFDASFDVQSESKQKI